MCTTHIRSKREEQAGFRAGLGCVDHIFTRQLVFLSKGVAFLDICSAVDYVDRSAPWYRLLKNGTLKSVSIHNELHRYSAG